MLVNLTVPAKLIALITIHQFFFFSLTLNLNFLTFQITWALRHSGTWTLEDLEALYWADSFRLLRSILPYSTLFFDSFSSICIISVSTDSYINWKVSWNYEIFSSTWPQIYLNIARLLRKKAHAWTFFHVNKMHHVWLFQLFFAKRKISLTFGIYLLRVSNKNTRTRCEICSKLIVKTPERRQWPCSDLVLVFLLLTLNMKSSAGLKLPNR